MPSQIKRSGLQALTSARVAQQTAGTALATSEVLAFQQAHALARDAVHAALDTAALAAQLPVPAVTLHSNAPDRAAYLKNPHLGRTLSPASAAQLQPGGYDLAIVIADGLSSIAVEHNATPVLQHLLPKLHQAGWTIAPIAVVEQGRVAIGDPIGHLLGARCTLVLLGERPGLSCPDSLGAYITWAPHPACTDADRVCLSNIHAEGIQPHAAADRLFAMLLTAKEMRRTGTALDVSVDSRRLGAQAAG